MLKITYDETCPHCGKKLKDIWDMGWRRGNNVLETDCPWCEKPIEITMQIYYEIREGENAQLPNQR